MTPSSTTVEMAVMLAGVSLPAWPIWRIQCRCISVPVSALLAGWLWLSLTAWTVELHPTYDGFGPLFAILMTPAVGIGYAVVLAIIRKVSTSGDMGGLPSPRCRPGIGLVLWAGVLAIALIAPFVARPPGRSDAWFMSDYFFYCGPILLLAATMSLTYLWRVACPVREPVTHCPDTTGPAMEGESRTRHKK